VRCALLIFAGYSYHFGMNAITARIRIEAGVRCPPVRIRRASLVSALLLAAAATCAFAQRDLSADDAAARDAAILAARAGNYAGPLDTLADLAGRYPETIGIRHDMIAVLAWAGRDADAIAAAESFEPSSLPMYALLPLAKSFRNVRQFDRAVATYQVAVAIDPANEQALIGLMLAHADNGDAAGVTAATRALAELEIETTDSRLASAYSMGSLGDAFEALRMYDDVLESDPANATALRGKALLLRSMLLPTQALEIARDNPGILSDIEVARLLSDEAAIRIRLASRTSGPGAARYAATDEAIEFLDRRLDETGNEDAAHALEQDRIVALVDALRADEAIAAWEALPQGRAPTEAYVFGAVAQAYLQAERPREALAAIETAIALDPGNINFRFTRVYAYVDLERFDEAFELAGQLTRELPLLDSTEDGRVVRVNDDGMRAQMLAGILEAYGDQLDAAQTRFERVLAEAPNNADARHELANVYRWRGWLDRSLFEYRQVLTNDADLLSARLGYAHAQIDAREYPEVDATVGDLAANFGREPAARRLLDRWAIHNMGELIVSGTTLRSSGVRFGSRASVIDAAWYTAPIAWRYRAFVRGQRSTARFPEGRAERERYGGGIEYRAPRWTATGELSGGSGTDFPGIRSTIDWRVSDHWAVGGALELDSYETQLRAHRVALAADLVSGTAAYTVSESLGTSFGISTLDYSDGNTQNTIFADGFYRVLNHPKTKVDLIGSVSVSASETELVPYFSPERSTTVLAGVEHEYRLFRRYTNSVTQNIALTGGRYGQNGLASGTIWRLNYEIAWRISDRLTLTAGVARRRDFYDAVREYTTTGLVAVNARF